MNQDSADVYSERLASGQLPPISTLRPYRVCWLCLVVLIAAPRLYAQLSAKEVLNGSRFSTFARFSVSPDNALIAYTVDHPKVAPDTATEEKPTDTVELWVTDLRTGQTKIVCCARGSAILPSWSPDGKSLAFYRSPKYLEYERWKPFVKEEDLVIWDRKTETSRVFLSGKLGPGTITVQPIWRKDNHSLMVLTQPVVGQLGQEVEDRKSSSATSDVKVRVLLALPPDKEANQGGTQPEEYPCARSDAALVDLENGTVHVVLKHVCPIHHDSSPDQQWFAFIEPKPLKSGSFFEEADVHLLSLRTLDDRIVLSNCAMYAGRSFPFSWSPDGRFVAFPDQRAAKGSAGQVRAASDYIVASLPNKSLRRLIAEGADDWVSIRRAVWSSDSEYLSLIRNNGLETWSLRSMARVSTISVPPNELLDIVSTSSGIAGSRSGKDYAVIVKTRDRESNKAGFWRMLPSSGKSEKLLEDDKAFNFYMDYQELLSDGANVLFVWESVDRVAELYRANSAFENVQRITDVGFWLEGTRLGRSRLVRWENNEGKELKGALLLPPDYEPGRRYPLIVDVYPDESRSILVNRFGLSETPGAYGNWQPLATRGYAVFVPEIRTTANSMMYDIAQSVTPGIKRMIEIGIADSGRIGVVGQSDGGYATLALLVQSKLFKAGVMVSGDGNLLDSYSYEYGRAVIEESIGLKATPWNNREVLIQNSPYFFLDKVQAPLLVITGSTDTAVPPHLGEAVFRGLRQLGRDAAYVEYQGEGHDPQTYSYPNQLDLYERIVGWFDKYLQVEPHQESSLSPWAASPR